MTDLEVRYKCACNPLEQTVSVPARRPDEDIKAWMDLCMGPALYLHHRRNSPTCEATNTEYVKIPYEDERLGHVAPRY